MLLLLVAFGAVALSETLIPIAINILSIIVNAHLRG